MALAGMAPFLSAVGPASAAMKLLGGGAQGTSPSPFGGAQPSPFDGAFNPDMAQFAPEPQPRGQQPAQLQSVFDETPGLMASALLGGDKEGAMLEDEPPPPVRIDLSKIAKDRNKPVRIDLSSMSRPRSPQQLAEDQDAAYTQDWENKWPRRLYKSIFGDVDEAAPPQGATVNPVAAQRSPQQLAEDQGYTVNSVMAQKVPLGSAPSAFTFQEQLPQGGVTEIPRLAPSGDVTDIPRSVFDDEVPAPVRAPAAPSAFEPQFDTSEADGEASPFGSFDGGINAVQDWLEGSPENPLFQTGMALLASGYDGSNPFTGTQAGLNAIPQLAMQRQKTELERRKGEAEIADAAQQKQLQEALAMIAAMYGDEGGEGPASQRSKGQATLVR